MTAPEAAAERDVAALVSRYERECLRSLCDSISPYKADMLRRIVREHDEMFARVASMAEAYAARTAAFDQAALDLERAQRELALVRRGL